MNRVNTTKKMRGLQSESVPVPPVLSGSRTQDALENGRGRLFGGSPVHGRERPASSVEESVPDVSGGDAGSVRLELVWLMSQSADIVSEARIKEELGSMMASGRKLTVAQAIARTMVHRALYLGSQQAMTDILDRIEGKATKAAPNKPGNSQLEEQLEVQIKDLDDLT